MENQTSQPIAQEPIQNPVVQTVSPKTQNNFAIIILSSLLIIMVGVVAFLGYQNWQLQKQITSLQTVQPPNPLVSPKPLAEAETSDWKNYSGEFGIYKYSFKYPNNLTPLVTENGAVSFFKDPSELASCKQEYHKGLEEKSSQNPCINNSFMVSVTAYTKQEYEESGIKNEPLTDPENFINGEGNTWKTDMSLIGTRALSGTIETNGNVYLVGIQSGLGENWSTNSGQDFRNFANQILSTFKFTK